MVALASTQAVVRVSTHAHLLWVGTLHAIDQDIGNNNNGAAPYSPVLAEVKTE